MSNAIQSPNEAPLDADEPTSVISQETDGSKISVAGGDDPADETPTDEGEAKAGLETPIDTTADTTVRSRKSTTESKESVMAGTPEKEAMPTGAQRPPTPEHAASSTSTTPMEQDTMTEAKEAKMEAMSTTEAVVIAIDP